MPTTLGLELINSTWPLNALTTPRSVNPSHSSLSHASPSDSDEDESDSLLEYSISPVHADGVPSSTIKLFPKNYRTQEFRHTVFELLRNELLLPGWNNLPDEIKSQISISKVSGSLTNAVFFVSCPSNSTITQSSISSKQASEDPPTVLLRIYGPSSGTLISRKEELHLLHTLSTKYGIGPLLLGTFSNGRVEQFFESRPLTKEEVRDPRISTWIARKMSELHSVDPFAVINPDQALRAYSQSSCRTNSLSSDSKWIPYSTNSPSLNLSASPTNTPQLTSPGPRSTKAGVWNNITRWQHEANKVFAIMIKTLDTLGFQCISPSTGFQSQDSLEQFRSCPPPLSSPRALSQFVKILDLPRFILEMKSYRAWIHNHEKIHGKSQRVFSHNDTQCGNLLLRLDDDPSLSEHPQDQIMVIDFEYASLNPRGFDIANHFHEWCADYHHPTLSHSLTSHGNYPTYSERKTFYRAYLGIDGPRRNNEDTRGFRKGSVISEFDLDLKDNSIAETIQDNETNQSIPTGQMKIFNGDEDEDSRVLNLENNVNLWSPASHAMWALWGLVQARDDLKIQLDRWVSVMDSGNLSCVDQGATIANNEEFEFDYFSYSAERIILFRKLLSDLRVPILH